ncbi:glycosyltransferase family 2 protein [Clostridiales bacterium FE2010]|nr:glycosyltransferase family 2 protein [Clostridiales bacterium FE2010]
MRSYQLLIAVMNQSDFSIVKKMNIHSDALIINQTDHFDYAIKDIGGKEIQMFSFAEKGVGLSRNTALMRSDADIIEFADEDMIFENNHQKLVEDEFAKHPEADAILFSLNSLNEKRPLLTISQFGRVSKREALKYGCARLAVKREKLIYNNISFSLLFGGGCRYGSGEDTILLQRMLDAGLKIYKSPIKVADVKQEESSWFSGLTEKYYHDKGAMFAAALPKLCWPYAIVTAIKSGNMSKAVKNLFDGIREFKRRR